MSVDMVGNFLTIIRNGTRIAMPSVVAPYTTMTHRIAQILHEEGFIRNATIEGTGIKRVLRIHLKFVNNESVIHEITRMSKPSRRLYESINQIKPVIGGLGLTILSTNKGVMTQRQAKEHAVGGEVLCTVW